MPKEIVQWPSTEGTDGTELSVHWSKGVDTQLPPGANDGGYVQIAATRHVWIPAKNAVPATGLHSDHSACSECIRPREEPNEPTARLAYSGSPGLDVPLEPATVFTDPLNRAQINALIRVLRRARDAAFGADA